LGLGLITLGSVGGAFTALKGPHLFARLRKGFTQALLAIGIGYLALSVFDLRPALYGKFFDPSVGKESAGGAVWMPYSEAALAEARAQGRPVIIDFWAEWCAACHELEQHTFRDRRVQLTFERFTLLRYDATKDSAELRELKTRWKIQGLPTVLFLNPGGVWLEDLTLTEFERPEKFLGRIEKALN
jgi:thiol:disulfide interchange protein DsbD